MIHVPQMFIKDSHDGIYNEYERLISLRKNKSIKIVVSIGLVLIMVISILILIKPSLMRNSLFLIIAAILGLIMIVSLLISTRYKSERPFFDYLLKEFAQDMLGSDLEYASYVKKDGHVLLESGLFPNAIVISKAMVKTKEMTIYLNKNIYTVSGNAVYQFFYGHYIVVPLSSDEVFQIRSKGKPSLKGGKWNRLDIDGYRIFLNQSNDVPQDRYIDILGRLKRLNDLIRPKSIYIAVTHDNIHLAYEPHKLIKRPYNLSPQIAQDIYEEMKEIINLGSRILQ